MREYKGIERPEFTPDYITHLMDEEIAPLFTDAMGVENICLPETFVKVITSSET